MKWLCREFSVLNGIPCHFEGRLDEKELSHEIKIDLFRICQDSLANVMYHAQARNVKVSIEDGDGKICLNITDDGKGFDIKQQSKMQGLISMRERAASINGKLAVHSESGKGTTVCFSVGKK